MARTPDPNTKSFNRVGNAPRVHSLKRTPDGHAAKQQWTRRMARTVNPNTKSFNRVGNAPRVHPLKLALIGTRLNRGKVTVPLTTDHQQKTTPLETAWLHRCADSFLTTQSTVTARHITANVPPI
ncbi:hypothetical protein K227x_45260 [Rubripirellula lacrimiformis]|uniref:Uncharacterized protein n=1 Tax=Rubripirellula lacrimiformis TaxID=1930273 RepID=A0A517NG56_9BACT|nr:hypothetical protein K227x_45260 [Rubripirellula lacrimiformis]